MSAPVSPARRNSRTSLHWVGVICGLAAGAGLGAAEAPTKLVTIGLTPFMVSLGMVAGDDPLSHGRAGRRWWEYLIAAAAVGIFAWLAAVAARPDIPFDAFWGTALTIVTALCIAGGGVVLCRRTRFS